MDIVIKSSENMELIFFTYKKVVFLLFPLFLMMKNMKSNVNYLSLNSGSKMILGQDVIASDPR